TIPRGNSGTGSDLAVGVSNTMLDVAIAACGNAGALVQMRRAARDAASDGGGDAGGVIPARVTVDGDRSVVERDARAGIGNGGAAGDHRAEIAGNTRTLIDDNVTIRDDAIRAGNSVAGIAGSLTVSHDVAIDPGYAEIGICRRIVNGTVHSINA